MTNPIESLLAEGFQPFWFVVGKWRTHGILLC